MRTVKPVPLTAEEKKKLGKPYDVGEWYFIEIDGKRIAGGPYTPADVRARVEVLVAAGEPRVSKHKTPGQDGPN